MDVHQPSGLVEPRRCVLIAQADVERQVGAEFPGVVDVVILAERAELNLRQRDRSLATFAVSQEKISIRMPPTAGWAGASGWLEAEGAPGKLIAHLVILVLAQFTSKPDGVLS